MEEVFNLSDLEEIVDYLKKVTITISPNEHEIIGKAVDFAVALFQSRNNSKITNQEYMLSIYGYNGYDIATAFKNGAEWQRNRVWHSANEEPDQSRLLCVCCADFRDKIIVIDEYKPKEQRFYYEDGEHYDYVSLGRKGLKWAYIEDLLPESLYDY